MAPIESGTEPSPSMFGFDSALLNKLERLAILSRRPVPGPSAGPRRSPQHGSSVEFADFRTYVAGDDYRRIDWNAYARLDRPYVRLYMAEQMTTLTVFLDHSRSMFFGEPTKALAASRLAAMLSYVALHTFDRVALVGWSGSIDARTVDMSGKGAVMQTWRRIAAIMDSPAERTDFGALREYGAYRHGPGLALVISDLLTDSDWRTGLTALQSCGQEVSVLQVLAPEELDPDLKGDWSLIDSETGRLLEVTISPRLLKRYQEEFAAHAHAVRDFCLKRGIRFHQTRSDADPSNDLLINLREAGILG